MTKHLLPIQQTQGGQQPKKPRFVNLPKVEPLSKDKRPKPPVLKDDKGIPIRPADVRDPADRAYAMYLLNNVWQITSNPAARAAFEGLAKYTMSWPGPPWPVGMTALKDWVDNIFLNEKAVKELLVNDSDFVATLIMVSNEIVTAKIPGATDDWLAKKLAMVSEGGAKLAAGMVDGCWRRYPAPFGLAPPLKAFFQKYLTDLKVDSEASGRCAVAFNLFWNAGADDLIVGLVQNGGDILQSAAVHRDVPARPRQEGVYSGFVLPLAHLMGQYVRRVHLAKSQGPLAPDDIADLNSAGRPRNEAAERVLTAIGAQQEAPIQTDYQNVLDCPMLKTLDPKKAMIWGFEFIRLPYTLAVHEKPDGGQPIRLMEIWGAVKHIFAQVMYEALTADPGTTIRDLVEMGEEEVKKNLQQKPPGFPGEYSPAFRDEVIKQATSFLEFLAGRAPDMKLATAEVRGQDLSKYAASHLCKAGLWWAKKRKQSVYYCLDGVKIQDVFDYKKVKTATINAHLGGTGKIYFDAITLAEVREILTHWDKDEDGTTGDGKGLKQVVTFVRKGVPMTTPENITEIEGWVKSIEEADKGVPPRNPPARAKLLELVAPLGLDQLLLPKLEDVDLLRITACVEMLRVAAAAKLGGGKVLAESLELSEVLFRTGLLPRAFKAEYKELVDMADPDERKAKIRELKKNLADPQINRYLSTVLTFALDNLPDPEPAPQ